MYMVSFDWDKNIKNYGAILKYLHNQSMLEIWILNKSNDDEDRIH